MPFTKDVVLNSFVDYGQKIKREDFIPFAERLAEYLVEHAKDGSSDISVAAQRCQCGNILATDATDETGYPSDGDVVFTSDGLSKSVFHLWLRKNSPPSIIGD